MSISYPIRILYVEDDEDDYIVTKDLLNETGSEKYTLTWIPQWKEALEELCAHPENYDVVLLDFSLGGFTGLDFMQTMQQKGVRLPAILLTGLFDRDVDVKVMEAGGADYLVKDRVDAALLERSIRYAIRQHEALEALRRSEERYALIVQGAQDGIWDWDLRADRIYYSPRWKTMIGYALEEISDTPHEWFSRVHPDDLARLKAGLERHIKGEDPYLQEEYRIKSRQGEWLWMMARGLVVRDDTGQAVRIAGSQTDITERKRLEGQLLHDALHDTLTGLANRALLLDRLSHLVARSKRHPKMAFALLFIDLDRFKMVNDTLGHAVGDQLLIKVAETLKSTLRGNDTVARLGGDEFVVLLEDIVDPVTAQEVADRIQALLKKPILIGTHEIFVGASIGIAVFDPKRYQNAEEILRDADTAMYKAKREGRGRSVTFEESLHVDVKDHFSLEMDMHQALERGEFLLHYQPIISLPDEQVVALEALIRWQHPRKGLVAPLDFIPLAEETGMISRVGEWVIHEICGMLERWHRQGLPQIRIAMNISAHQFRNNALLNVFEKILNETPLQSPMIELEITESVMMKNLNETVRVLSILREKGITVAIDDFGTGYSSLGSLKNLPIDALKVDQSFVRDLDTDENSAIITRAIVSLAHHLGLKVIAEGVERPQQAAFLKEIGCDQVQGYLFSRPVPENEIMAFVQART